MHPLPAAARPDLGTPVSTNRALDLKLRIRRSQLTTGVPPEIIVGSVGSAGSAQTGLYSHNPLLPKTQSRERIKMAVR